jgi:hypothetical protein
VSSAKRRGNSPESGGPIYPPRKCQIASKIDATKSLRRGHARAKYSSSGLSVSNSITQTAKMTIRPYARQPSALLVAIQALSMRCEKMPVTTPAHIGEVKPAGDDIAR